MSHTSVVKNVSITDLEALDRAVMVLSNRNSLGVTIQQDSIPTMYYDNQFSKQYKGTCAKVYTSNKSDYGLGVYKDQETNTYGFVYDNWKNNISNAFGDVKNPVGLLLAEYNAEVIKQQAYLQGYMVEETFAESGERILELATFA